MSISKVEWCFHTRYGTKSVEKTYGISFLKILSEIDMSRKDLSILRRFILKRLLFWESNLGSLFQKNNVLLQILRPFFGHWPFQKKKRLIFRSQFCFISNRPPLLNVGHFSTQQVSVLFLVRYSYPDQLFVVSIII